MNVLSLFDGMSCGRLAFKEANIPVEKYFAYEIDKYAIKVAKNNFPSVVECGDVFEADFLRYRGQIDFLIGGSPCTYWSIAKKNNRETKPSGLGWKLFSQYVRALQLVKPKYFIYENNRSMSDEIRDSIRETFGFKEECINSSIVSAQNRIRYYWVGKRDKDGSYSKVNIIYPEEREIALQEVLDRTGSKDLSDRELAYMVRTVADGRNHFDFDYHQNGTKSKGQCLTANICKGVPYNVCCDPVKKISIEGHKVYRVKDNQLYLNGKAYHLNIADGLYIIRKLTVRECKRLQTIPEWYDLSCVSNTQALKMLGNGWTVSVIRFLILSCLN